MSYISNVSRHASTITAFSVTSITLQTSKKSTNAKYVWKEYRNELEAYAVLQLGCPLPYFRSSRKHEIFFVLEGFFCEWKVLSSEWRVVKIVVYLYQAESLILTRSRNLSNEVYAIKNKSVLSYISWKFVPVGLYRTKRCPLIKALDTNLYNCSVLNFS